MEIIKYIIFGIVQGLTEFLPVSSSAHLVFAEKILGPVNNDVAFFVLLHLGTVLALLVFFFKDIIALFKNLKIIGLILLATLITGAIGVLGKDYFESLFSSVGATAWQLIISGVILIIANFFVSGKRKEISLWDSVLFGLAQAVAIIPGISRSGATISILLFRHIDRDTAFTFSFLASIPAVLGAAILEIKDVDLGIKISTLNFSAGFIFSFLSGLLSLYLVKIAIKRAKLHIYGYYCIIVAVLVLIFLR